MIKCKDNDNVSFDVTMLRKYEFINLVWPFNNQATCENVREFNNKVLCNLINDVYVNCESFCNVCTDDKNPVTTTTNVATNDVTDVIDNGSCENK